MLNVKPVKYVFLDTGQPDTVEAILKQYYRVFTGAGKDGKTYSFSCPEAGKAGKKYTLDIKLA